MVQGRGGVLTQLDRQGPELELLEAPESREAEVLG